MEKKKLDFSKVEFHCHVHGQKLPRHSIKTRHIYGSENGKPVDFECRVPVFYCVHCSVAGCIKSYHTYSPEDIAFQQCSYTKDVIRAVIILVVASHTTLEKTAETIRKTLGLKLPTTTMHEWVTDKKYEQFRKEIVTKMRVHEDPAASKHT